MIECSIYVSEYTRALSVHVLSLYACGRFLHRSFTHTLIHPYPRVYIFTLTLTHVHTRTPTHKSCLHSRNCSFVCPLITNFLRHNFCITIFRATKEFHSTIHLFHITALHLFPITAQLFRQQQLHANQIASACFSPTFTMFFCVRVTYSFGHMAPLFFPHPSFFLFFFCTSTWAHDIFVCVR